VGLPSLKQSFVVGSISTLVGEVPQISCTLTWIDHWGTFKARWGVGRMHYAVEPGLYAVGDPDSHAPVLVTANYKMSFDCLRQVLGGRNAWILVLDTKGINVWCSAGKGTFGTGELMERIASSGLDRVVSHRRIILPQLAAPGVAAHEVKKLSGFKVIYGPIRAKDLPAFLDGGLKATPQMRLKTFPIRERIVLIPVELVGAFKTAGILFLVLSILGGFCRGGDFWTNTLNCAIINAGALLSAILAGAVLTPVLLPWLPGRAFSFKGAILGILAAGIFMLWRWEYLPLWKEFLDNSAWFFLVPAASSYLAMNFTGASTYTSLSGVKKEMRRAVPLQIGAGVVGLGLLIGSCLAA
jgi:hypothetical protein